MRPKRLVRQILDLRLFDDDPLFELDSFVTAQIKDYMDVAAEYGLTVDDVPELEVEYEQHLASDEILDRVAFSVADGMTKGRATILDQVLGTIASNSLMAEVSMYLGEDRAIHVVPYHAHSIHGVPIPGDEVIFIRPGRASQKQWSRFETAILRLEQLLSDPAVKERQIEELLVENPLFLRGLNYREVYPQVVLPRENEPSLKPDLIAEPVGDEWSHIIDLKLPMDPILVGSYNRPRLSAALVEAAAQLREYHAYFDDRKLAARVEERFGIKCYKPRMVVIIGRDPKRFTPEQQRRALTSYPDLEFVS